MGMAPLFRDGAQCVSLKVGRYATDNGDVPKVASITRRRSPRYCQLDSESPLDRWISYAVKVLRDAGIETYESCQGGTGHSYREPAVRFHGARGDGFKAVAAALEYGLPVRALRRFWHIDNGEPTGPHWELTFWERPLKRLQREAERTGLIT
jgi:hypothetical protein